MSSTVVIAGGSGFLGRALTAHLRAHGYRVLVLSRSATPLADPDVETAVWDASTAGSWCDRLEGASAVINLVGRSVNCRYTPENRREILQSRIDSTIALRNAIVACHQPPQAFVQAGSLAIYGDASERICTEQAPAATGFSPEVCIQWEAATNSVALPATRTVLLRIGFALGRDGGALQPLSALARWFLGGTVGSGNQYISWIHVDDLNEMFRSSIEEASVSGVFNATGPTPVRNREFMRELRAAHRRPWAPPTPSLAVKLGAYLMGTEPSLALTGRRCLPTRFLERGFPFRFPRLKDALADLLG